MLCQPGTDVGLILLRTTLYHNIPFPYHTSRSRNQQNRKLLLASHSSSWTTRMKKHGNQKIQTFFSSLPSGLCLNSMCSLGVGTSALELLVVHTSVMAVGCFNQLSMLPGEDKISFWGTNSSPSPPNTSGLFHSCWSPIPNASECLPSPWHSVYSWISGTEQASLNFSNANWRHSLSIVLNPEE
ncbi:hypothetical protein LOAG_07315 [Loa loa]|uniref:Uncharacterized protein n=1 Tax=Loa loa TaxID=7209 RepID=A0A1S0TWI6_LOALO|nr:hypothetical protein LOAG_07315 [Loa loa]EFO21173.1 hypothetical protein LOAG_07315 [Loa loa]